MVSDNVVYDGACSPKTNQFTRLEESVANKLNFPNIILVKIFYVIDQKIIATFLPQA